MELKCHCHEVMNVEVINIFYLTKMMCDTETDCLCCCLYKKLITINLKHIGFYSRPQKYIPIGLTTENKIFRTKWTSRPNTL